MRGMDAQTGGGYVYQWQCAMLLALNCFFVPAPDDPLYRLVTGFFEEVTAIQLEGEDLQRHKKLEDINLIGAERRILVQVKAKERSHASWTPSDSQLLKALNRFYHSPFLAQQPDDTHFLFLTNRQFNKDLVTIQQAIREGTLDRCPEADKLFDSLNTYAVGKERPPLAIDRFREMLARTTLLKYLDEDYLRNAVQLTLQAYGQSDWQQAYSVLSDYFQWESTRKGGGIVTRTSITEKLGPYVRSGPSLPTPDQMQAHPVTLREQLKEDVSAWVVFSRRSPRIDWLTAGSVALITSILGLIFAMPSGVKDSVDPIADYVLPRSTLTSPAPYTFPPTETTKPTMTVPAFGSRTAEDCDPTRVIVTATGAVDSELRAAWENSRLYPYDGVSNEVELLERTETTVLLYTQASSPSDSDVIWQISSKSAALEKIAAYTSSLFPNDLETARSAFLGGMIRSARYVHENRSFMMTFEMDLDREKE